MKLLRFGLASLALALATFTSAAQAQTPVVLRFTTLSPPNWLGVVQMMRPWAQKVTAESKGTIDIQLVDGFSLGNYANVYDRVLDDVIQISWGSPSAMGGLFPKTDVVSLPFLGDGSEKASAALWKLYADGLIADEYKAIKPLGMFVPPQSGIHTRKNKITSLADLQGLRLRAGGKALNDVVSALGATPNSINVGEVYTALQRGTIDGTVLPWTAFDAFKLQEVTFEHLDITMGSGALIIFMSQKKFDALPEDARKAIEANSGESMSRTMGKLFDNDREKERQNISTMKGHAVNELAPDELARWKAKVQPVVDGWGKTVPNGEKVIQAFSAMMK